MGWTSGVSAAHGKMRPHLYAILAMALKERVVTAHASDESKRLEYLVDEHGKLNLGKARGVGTQPGPEVDHLSTRGGNAVPATAKAESEERFGTRIASTPPHTATTSAHAEELGSLQEHGLLEPPKKSNTGILIFCICAGVVVLALLVVVGRYMMGGEAEERATAHAKPHEHHEAHLLPPMAHPDEHRPRKERRSASRSRSASAASSIVSSRRGTVEHKAVPTPEELSKRLTPGKD